MATNKKTHSNRRRRLGEAIAIAWLLVLLSHTLATIAVILLGHALHISACGD